MESFVVKNLSFLCEERSVNETPGGLDEEGQTPGCEDKVEGVEGESPGYEDDGNGGNETPC